MLLRRVVPKRAWPLAQFRDAFFRTRPERLEMEFLQPDASALVAVAWPFKVHMVLGMTIFLLFPFSRLVHVWSGFATIAYLFRPYQVVRSRRLNVPAGHNLPRQPGAGV